MSIYLKAEDHLFYKKEMDTVQGISRRSSGGVSVCVCVCVSETHVMTVSLAEVSSSKAWTVMPTLIRPFSSRI